MFVCLFVWAHVYLGAQMQIREQFSYHGGPRDQIFYVAGFPFLILLVTLVAFLMMFLVVLTGYY